MNKQEFICKLSKEIGYSYEDCTIINNILEDNFVISRKSKDKIVEELISKLEVEDDEANKIYEMSISIIRTAIKNKLKHPLGTKN